MRQVQDHEQVSKVYQEQEESRPPSSRVINRRELYASTKQRPQEMNQAKAITAKQWLSSLSDEELGRAVLFIYPLTKNLVKSVAASSGRSMGHLQRILEGERASSSDITAAIVKEIRARLEPVEQLKNPEPAATGPILPYESTIEEANGVIYVGDYPIK